MYRRDGVLFRYRQPIAGGPFLKRVTRQREDKVPFRKRNYAVPMDASIKGATLITNRIPEVVPGSAQDLFPCP